MIFAFARIAGIGLILATLGLCLIYPFGNPYLTTGLIFYASLLYIKPLQAIFFIPFLLPILNLAPWSGVVLFEEFDLFLAVTLGVFLLKGIYFHRWEWKPSKLFITSLLIFLVSVFIGCIQPLYSFISFEPDDMSSYLSIYNGLRLSRSYLWAILLLPVLGYCWSLDKRVFFKRLFTGFSMGIVGVCLIVFWERGIINDFFNASNRWDLLRNLLDFSSEYRITALFSEMNTGGSAIDGYIALTWVFPLALYTRQIERTKQSRQIVRNTVFLLIYLTALGAGLYVIATTFTRITYLAFGVSGFVYLAGMVIFKNHREKKLDSIYYIFSFLFIGTFVASVAYLFTKGGFLSLFSSLLLLGGGIAVGVGSKYLPVWGSIVSAGLVFGIGSYLMARGILTSKWVETDPLIGIAISGLLSWLILTFTTGLSKLIAHRKMLAGFLGFTLPLLIVVSISIPMVLGNRMQTRFSESTKDAKTRFTHWANVLQTMDKDLSSLVFGMGMGSFPRYFIQRNQDAQSLGTYSYVKQGKNVYLQLSGGKDMEIGQRFFPDKKPGQDYLLQFKARSNMPDAKISFRICRRNLLHAANCKYYRIRIAKSTYNQWTEYQIPIEKDVIERFQYKAWPIVFLTNNHRLGYFIDLDDISLIGASGKNVLDNGNFQNGGARWYSYNEFEHLPWHTKSIWLHLLFEQGALGAAGFFLLSLFGCFSILKGIKTDKIAGMALLASIAGFQVIGFTGTLLDAPRVALMYYMIVFSSNFLHFKRHRNES